MGAKIFRAVFTAAVALLATVSLVGGASAGTTAPSTGAPTPGSPSPAPLAAQSLKETASMILTGYDVAVANAHGYQIVTVNGQEKSVKVSNHAIHQADATLVKAALTPVVTGNCGTSFLYYAAHGGKKATLYTGFDILRLPTVHFTWEVKVTDKVGTGLLTWTGPHTPVFSWDITATTTHTTVGYSVAQVSTGIAVLEDGSVCNTGYPGQGTDLY